MSPDGLALVGAIPLAEAERRLLAEALAGETSPEQAAEE
jgi:hypothetical protein